MKKKFLILLLMILRESGTLNLDYYRFTLQKQIQTNRSTNSINDISIGKKTTFSTGEPQPLEIPVRVEYRGKVLYKDPTPNISAVVTITGLDDGFLWSPLYKHSGISAGAQVRLEGTNDPLYWDGSRVDLLQVTGNYSLSGTVSILGICSRRTAADLVRKDMVKSFVEHTKQYFAVQGLGL